MPLSIKEAFKAGFLLKCAEDGLTPTQVEERVKLASVLLTKKNQVKEAFSYTDIPMWALGAGADAAKYTAEMIPKLGYLGALAGFGVPAVGGFLGGYGASQFKYTDKDVEDAQRQNLIAEYMRLAQEAKRRHEITRLRNV